VHRGVLNTDQKRAAYQALEDRIRNGAGRASPEQRDRAFRNAGLSGPLAGLVGKVATRPTEITDADFAAARAAGCTEDELFELVVCAAVGQSARLYDAGLAALADAAGGAGGGGGEGGAGGAGGEGGR
jgi:alkylhydroperoxidase family enzyme